VSAIEATRDPRDNAVDAFDWSPPTSGRVVAGSGALARLPALLSDLGVRHAILWDAWQAERYQRGETGQRPGYTGNPFRPR
jgi:hypothetical protein